MMISTLRKTLAAFLLTTATASALPCPGDCVYNGHVSVVELLTAVRIALGIDPVARCERADADGNQRVTIGELIQGVNAALDGCSDSPLAVVIATDFQTASIATRPTVPTTPERRVVNADAAIRGRQDRYLYVINRFGADNIQLMDAARGLVTLAQCSTGTGSNPHDIAFSGSKTYVTLYDRSELLVVADLRTRPPECDGFVLGSIDLGPFADADGVPEMSQMAVVGNRLFVSLQRLDRDAFFAPAGPGALIVIDVRTDEILGETTLSGTNPFAATKGLPVVNGKILVAQIGNFGELDGGIERVDPISMTAEGFFVTEAELGGDLSDFVIVSESLGYAVVTRPDFTNDVATFDPSAGTRTGTLLSGAQSISDIEVSRSGLWVADRTSTRPGIRIFRIANGIEQTAGPIDVGLPPFEIVFLR